MPVVEVNGQELEFPDSMSQDAIKAVLQKKFPSTKQAAPVAPEPAPEPPNPVNDMMAGIIKSLAGRTGRIATGIAGQVADLPVVAAQSAYDTARSLQQMSNTSGYGANLPNQVAPAYKIPLPSESLKKVYDVATGGAGNVGGTAGAIDKAAETIVPLAGAATQIVPAALKQLVPRASSGIRSLAARSIELGIPLRVDQVAPSRAVNTLQKVSQEIPFSGVDASEANQLIQWNKALAKTLGQNADNLAPDVINQFRKDAAVKFGSVVANKDIAIDKSDVEKIKNIVQGASQSLGADSLSIVRNNVQQALKDIKAGNITGDKLSDLRSNFLGNTVTAEGGAKHFIGKIVDAIDNIASKNISPNELEQLNIARREWRNYRTVEPLLEKSVDGSINPTELLNRIKSSKYITASRIKLGDDPLVDLARIGKQLLAKKGGSDTLQKSLAVGGMGKSLATGGMGGLAAAAIHNPAAAITGAITASVGMGMNRGLQALNQGLTGVALTPRNFDPQMSKLLTALTASSLTTKGE